MRRPSPLFICGAARSGTTLLLRLLDSHPSLAVIPWETQVYPALASRLPGHVLWNIADRTGAHWLAGLILRPPLHQFAFRGRAVLAIRLQRWMRDFPDIDMSKVPTADIAARVRSPAQYWWAFVEALELLTGLDASVKAYWVEKTPLNERFVPVTDQIFGRTCHYVHVIRDPRSVIASWLARAGTAAGDRHAAVIDRCFIWARSLCWCVRNLRYCPRRYHGSDSKTS